MITSRIFLFLACLAMLSSAIMARGQGGEWEPLPLVAHEWGVHVFDWQGNTPVAGELPAFMYSAAKLGTVVPTTQRVRDLPPDSGMRDKPLLYFYTPGEANPGAVIPVEVEVRFTAGQVTAWWPQVSTYSTPAQVASATSEDQRFELVWHHLALTATAPTLPPAGGDLPADHWVTRARQVDSRYVSNGREADKFLFYEGRTTEKPVITLLPPQGRGDAHYHLLNVGAFPIYDVFAIYRDSRRGVVWTQYLAELPPLPSVPARRPRNDLAPMTALPLPEVAALPENHAPDAATFAALTRARLLDVLTAGEFFTAASGNWLRDPADFQPPTTAAQLFPAEARALEAIWRQDFFAAEGLTVLYREAPAYLDQAMPLRLYTDMYHFIKLSRCGLVLNQHVPITMVNAVNAAVLGSRAELDKRDEYLRVCRQNRFLALGLARYYAATMPTAGYEYIDTNTLAPVHTDSPWFPRLVAMLENDQWVNLPVMISGSTCRWGNRVWKRRGQGAPSISWRTLSPVLFSFTNSGKYDD